MLLAYSQRTDIQVKGLHSGFRQPCTDSHMKINIFKSLSYWLHSRHEIYANHHPQTPVYKRYKNRPKKEERSTRPLNDRSPGKKEPETRAEEQDEQSDRIIRETLGSNTHL